MSDWNIPEKYLDQSKRIAELEAENERLQDGFDKMTAVAAKASEDRDRLQTIVDGVKDAWAKAADFDNYECYYGAHLGECPTSNDCWECQLHKALAEKDDDTERLGL